MIKAFENQTHITTHNRREYNPPPWTHMLIKGTYKQPTQQHRRQQFPWPVILTPKNDHIDQNM
jgi:hypothetical protein